MQFSRQEHWSGLTFPSPEEFPNPGMKPWSPASQADSLPFELQGSVFIYLAASGLSCVMRALQLWHVGSPAVACGLSSPETCDLSSPTKD